MTAVVLSIASGLFAYVVDALLVGALIGAIRLRSGKPALGRGLFLGLVVVFAVLDLYWMPVVLGLDLTLKIGNPDAARILGSELPGTTLLSPGWVEVIVWLAQGLVALWVADRLSRRAA